MRSGLQPVDYLSLNDGLDDDTVTNPRKRKRITHRPRSAPSATRVAAQKHTVSPEANDTDNTYIKPSTSTLSAVPYTSTTNESAGFDLTGIPTSSNMDNLPDLVINRETSNLEPDTAKTVDPVSTEEELEAADALLSLGEVHDDTLDEVDNTQLMPVGVPTNIVDAAPIPVRLDQLNVDTAIADIIQTEELEQQDAADITPVPDENNGNKPAEAKDKNSKNAEGTTEDRPISASPTQGTLKIKTHSLKKKADSNRKYKCSVCGVSKSSMQRVNEHHLRKHKPHICPVCGRTFALASSLTRHAYDHEEQ